MSLFWLGSFPKSGSTWLRKFLQAYIAGPPLHLNQAHPRFRGDLREVDYQGVSRAPVTKISFPEQVHLRPAALYNMDQEIPGRIYVKTHNALSQQYGIELIPPHLCEGAIYIIRDPRDVAISYASHFGLDIDQAIHALGHNGNMVQDPDQPVFSHAVGSWSGHVQSWTERQDHPAKVVGIKYEDMIQTPETTFSNVVLTLGLEYDESRLSWSLEQTSFSNLRSQEDEKGFVEKSAKATRFFRSGTSGEWRSVLTTAQADRILEQHGETMERFGYA